MSKEAMNATTALIKSILHHRINGDIDADDADELIQQVRELAKHAESVDADG